MIDEDYYVYNYNNLCIINLKDLYELLELIHNNKIDIKNNKQIYNYLNSTNKFITVKDNHDIDVYNDIFTYCDINIKKNYMITPSSLIDKLNLFFQNNITLFYNYDDCKNLMSDYNTIKKFFELTDLTIQNPNLDEGDQTNFNYHNNNVSAIEYKDGDDKNLNKDNTIIESNINNLQKENIELETKRRNAIKKVIHSGNENDKTNKNLHDEDYNDESFNNFNTRKIDITDEILDEGLNNIIKILENENYNLNNYDYDNIREELKITYNYFNDSNFYDVINDYTISVIKNKHYKQTFKECTDIADKILTALNHQNGGVNPHLTDFLKHFLK